MTKTKVHGYTEVSELHHMITRQCPSLEAESVDTAEGTAAVVSKSSLASAFESIRAHTGIILNKPTNPFNPFASINNIF